MGYCLQYSPVCKIIMLPLLCGRYVNIAEVSVAVKIATALGNSQSMVECTCVSPSLFYHESHQKFNLLHIFILSIHGHSLFLFSFFTLNFH